METIPRRGWRALIGVLAVLALLAAGCGEDEDSEGATSGAEEQDSADSAAGGGDESADAGSVPVIDIVAKSATGGDGPMTHSFEPLEDVTAGPAQLNLVNEGSEPHHVQLLKLNEGVTMDDVRTALGTGNPGALFQVGAFAGGTGVADPGSESAADALVDLEEGTYVMLCFIEGRDGVPHLAHGMVEPLEVGEADGEVAEMPEADVTVNLVDFGFDQNKLPSNGIVEVVNTSERQPHEMNLLRLAEGKSGQDVAAFFGGQVQGPPPFSSVGGMQGLAPGASQLLVLEDVPAGDYMMICLIPDPTDGVPHAQKGMATAATVG